MGAVCAVGRVRKTEGLAHHTVKYRMKQLDGFR
jgi:hypothetical protein